MFYHSIYTLICIYYHFELDCYVCIIDFVLHIMLLNNSVCYCQVSIFVCFSKYSYVSVQMCKLYPILVTCSWCVTVIKLVSSLKSFIIVIKVHFSLSVLFPYCYWWWCAKLWNLRASQTYFDWNIEGFCWYFLLSQLVVWMHSVFPLYGVVVKVVNIKYRASVCLFFVFVHVRVCTHMCSLTYFLLYYDSLLSKFWVM